ncbi:hypothetical protein OA498_04340, partial [Candidatus Pelagibacter bacterium]|nr:hypothetical protein [Candidatus Pelagibacter bacterium]
MKSVLFIFDDNKKFGNGHFQRCQKFKKIFTNDHKIRFIQSDNKKLFNTNKKTFDYIVLDSYKINYLDEIKLKKLCNKLITIDDLKNRKFTCDYLLNYSPIVKKEDYKKKIGKNTKLLLGPKFNFIYENIQFKKT